VEKITYALSSQVIFATMSNRKDENFFYIAVGELQVLAHFRDIGARNLISQQGFRSEKLMENSVIHVIFLVIQIIISKLAESG
jgi:hypothetical protein